MTMSASIRLAFQRRQRHQRAPDDFEVNGKQYVVNQSGLNRNALAINSIAPELLEMRNQTMLFVFGS
jgi:hypothetical protein